MSKKEHCHRNSDTKDFKRANQICPFHKEQVSSKFWHQRSLDSQSECRDPKPSRLDPKDPKEWKIIFGQVQNSAHKSEILTNSLCHFDLDPFFIFHCFFWLHQTRPWPTPETQSKSTVVIIRTSFDYMDYSLRFWYVLLYILLLLGQALVSHIIEIRTFDYMDPFLWLL